jgi:hypothetical protein
MYIGLYVNYPFFLSDLMELEFPRQISKNIQISNFMKILPEIVELFQSDGQIDMTKPIVVFRSFANAHTRGNAPHFINFLQINL